MRPATPRCGCSHRPCRRRRVRRLRRMARRVRPDRCRGRRARGGGRSLQPGDVDVHLHLHRCTANHVVLEPEEADRARAGVRPDDGAERRRDRRSAPAGEGRARARARLSRSGASACAMPTRRFGVSRVLSANARENSCTAFWFPRTRLIGSTSPSSIDRIGLMCSRLPANAAALPMRPPFCRNSSVSTVKISPASRLNRSTSSSISSSRRAALEPALDREPEHRDRRRRGLGVDDAHLVAELRGGRARALERAGELRGDLQRVDPLVARELLVGGEEIARRRLRGRRQLGHGAQPRIELLRADLDVVAPALVAEADVERHHPPVREALLRLREVGGRVEDDRRVRGGEVHAAAAW